VGVFGAGALRGVTQASQGTRVEKVRSEGCLAERRLISDAGVNYIDEEHLELARWVLR